MKTISKEVKIAKAEKKLGSFESLNFYIDHESLDFIGYEFEGVEIELEETGGQQSLFRLDIKKRTGEMTVYSAYSEDFDVMEVVTDYFDIEKLYKDIMDSMKQREFDNYGETYVKYCQEIEAGACSETAILRANNN